MSFHSSWNGVSMRSGRGASVQHRLRRLCGKAAYMIHVGLQRVLQQRLRWQKDGLTVIIFCFCFPTGPQRTIRFRVAAGRNGQGGGPFVAWLSEDGPVKLVTLWWISSCRLLAPLPCLSSPWPSRIQATPLRRGNDRYHTSVYSFQIKLLYDSGGERLWSKSTTITTPYKYYRTFHLQEKIGWL